MSLVISVPEPTVLPIFILADHSASMSEDGKIRVLNRSIRELIASFALPISRPSIRVGVITFGDGGARVHMVLTPVAEAKLDAEIEACGDGPLSAALRIARLMLEDGNIVRRSDFRPVLILISDGHPTDDWRQALDELDRSACGRRADRFALGVGLDLDQSTLQRFVAPVLARKPLASFHAGEEWQIHKALEFAGPVEAMSFEGGGPGHFNQMEL